MELYSVLRASLDGRGVWGRMDTCILIPWTEKPGGLQSMGSQKVGHNWVTNTIHICMAESLHCSPETTTILLITFIPIQHKKFEVWKKKKRKKWVLAKHFSADVIGVGDNIRTFHTQTVDTESGWNLEIITQRQSKQFEGSQVISQGTYSEMQATVPRGTRRTNRWWPLCRWY